MHFLVVVTSCWSQLDFQSCTQVLHYSSHWHTISKGFVTSLPASISVCISSNDEYHASFAATPDYHLYATHCFWACGWSLQQWFLRSCLTCQNPSHHHPPGLFLNYHVLNPSSEKNNCLLNNSTVQPQPITFIQMKFISLWCNMGYCFPHVLLPVVITHVFL